jgi:large repetitive protein
VLKQAATDAAKAATDAKTALALAVNALGSPATPAQLADVETKQVAAITAATKASTKAAEANDAASAAKETEPSSVAVANTAASDATAAAIAAATDVISSAAQINNATQTSLSVDVYKLAGITDIGGAGEVTVLMINSALNSVAIAATQTSTPQQIQGIVDSYNKILTEANGSAPDADVNTNPLQSDYVRIGVNLGSAATDARTDPETYALLSDIIANRSSVDVNTIDKINNLARIANAIQLTAADGTPAQALTAQDLADIGIANAFTQNQLSNFLRIVASKPNGGEGSSSLSQLNTIAAGDLTSPNAPELVLGTGVSGGATSAEALAGGGVITVNGEIGSTLVVTFTDSAGHTVTKTVNGTGEAQAVTLLAADLGTGANQLGDGNITVSVVATDAAGNPSSPGTNNFILDTTAPATPSINPVEGDGIVNAAEAAAGFTITGTAEAGATVTIKDGTTVVGTTTANATTGAWSFTPGTALGEGLHSITATATDAAGNTGAATSALAFTIDTTAPTQTVSIVSITDDVGHDGAHTDSSSDGDHGQRGRGDRHGGEWCNDG